jgi:hypothetical protein
MWSDEEMLMVADEWDDWRVGAVLQGAVARRPPAIERLRQPWMVAPPRRVPELEPTHVHDRTVAVLHAAMRDDRAAARVVAAFPDGGESREAAALVAAAVARDTRPRHDQPRRSRGLKAERRPPPKTAVAKSA